MDLFQIASIPNCLNMLLILENLWELFEELLDLLHSTNGQKPHELIRLLHGYRSTNDHIDVWENLSTDWDDFFWLTGETPNSLQHMSDQIQRTFPRRSGPLPRIDFRNQILLTMTWMRRYPTMYHLAMHFNISVGYVCKIIHKMLPIMHFCLVPKYIQWHSMNKWRSLAGTYPEWPRVVGILDCTPFRISRPMGNLQRLFWRRDRRQFFQNWIVIVDAEGFIVYSRPGFVGHLHDATCMQHIQLPVLPQGLQIMADQGFANRSPLLIPPRRNQRQQINRRMRRSFRSRRSFIERCFGIMKSTYGSISSRYRGRRWSGTVVCNVAAALYNRRKLLLQAIRNHVNRN